MNKVWLASGVSCLSVRVGLVGLVSCGGSVSSNDQADSGTPLVDTGFVAEDAGPAPDTTPPPVADAAPAVDAAPLDYGAPSDKYPAFTPDMPQIVTQGDGVLHDPIIVSVTYPGEVNADAYEQFGDKLGDTAYWKTAVSEYGVGPTKSGPANHVRMTTALPADMSDGDIDNYIGEHATNYAKYGWPAPTDQTIYTLYMPNTTSVSLGGMDACSNGIGGYHTSTNAGDTVVAYAIVLQCSFGGGGGGKARVATVTATHEIAEAATDPHPESSTRGYMGVDNNHIAWNIFMSNNVENGDLCEIYRESRYSDTVDVGFTYNVQRLWSNSSAKAGHNPCVPAPTTEPYYNVVALDQVKTTLNAVDYFGTGKQPTMGYHAAVGETITFPIGFWSDAAMPEWTVKVTEGSPLSATAPARRLSVSIDKTSGKNGQKAYVTVRVNSLSPQKASVVTVVSSNGASQHYMPIIISSQ